MSVEYVKGEYLINKGTGEKVSIKRITEEMSPVGMIHCFELEPVGYTLPKNANYFITQATLEEYFEKEE